MHVAAPSPELEVPPQGSEQSHPEQSVRGVGAQTVVAAQPTSTGGSASGIGGLIFLVVIVLMAIGAATDSGTEEVRGQEVNSACAEEMREVEDQTEALLYSSGEMGTWDYIKSGGYSDQLVLSQCRS